MHDPKLILKAQEHAIKLLRHDPSYILPVLGELVVRPDYRLNTVTIKRDHN